METTNDIGLRVFEASATANAPRGGQDLGKNEFLELLVTQLENQDPLEPLDNTDFIAQLAQFSSLEGIQNISTSVDALTSSLRGTRIADGASMIGRAALAQTAVAAVDGDEPIAGLLRLEEPAQGVSVEIAAPSGELLERIELGDLDFGDTGFEWSAARLNGDRPERVSIRAIAGSGDEAVSVPVYLPVGISGVTLAENGSGNLSYRLDTGALVSANDILELR